MQIAIGFVVAAVLVPTFARAQSGEAEQRAACTGDAFRFCATEIPD